MQQAGLFEGIDGNFQPTTNMTRAQMAKVLVLAFNLTSSNKDTFKDVPKHTGHTTLSLYSQEMGSQLEIMATLDQMIL